MLFLRLSLAALCFGFCVAQLDSHPTRFVRALHHPRKRLELRALSIQELSDSRASLSPAEQPFFDMLVVWMNKAQEMMRTAAQPSSTPTSSSTPTPARSPVVLVPSTTISATTREPSPTPSPSTTATPVAAPTPTFGRITTRTPTPPPSQPPPASTSPPIAVAKPAPPPPAAQQAPPPPPPPAPASNGFQSLALATHNDFRAKHGAKPLTWSGELEGAARKWASNCQFRHSQGAVGPFGENLSLMSGSDNNVAQGIQMWNDEAPDYNPGNPVASHFTQVVWKATTELGCAVVACNMPEFANGATSNFYVCEYKTAGNVFPASNFQQNVQP